jgi:hypothetical protein
MKPALRLHIGFMEAYHTSDGFFGLEQRERKAV